MSLSESPASVKVTLHPIQRDLRPFADPHLHQGIQVRLWHDIRRLR